MHKPIKICDAGSGARRAGVREMRTGGVEAARNQEEKIS
jgi:hypothetical protein